VCLLKNGGGEKVCGRPRCRKGGSQGGSGKRRGGRGDQPLPNEEKPINAESKGGEKGDPFVLKRKRGARKAVTPT